MDIRGWLQNTADREPPDAESHPSFSGHHLGAAAQVRTRHHRKRKHASSESGGERARPHPRGGRRRGQAAVRPSSSEDARAVQGNAANARRDRSSHRSRGGRSSVSAREVAPTKTYERRARHKTKPDRYTAKQKEHRNEKEDRRDSKKKSKRRESHRTGDGARTSGLVQNFRLKNGPKNDRLTLLPGASAGIFKHGRASEAMPAAGPGLPDLSFNEMTFLSRPKQHQDSLSGDDDAKHKSKKSRKELREEEISTYFQRASAGRAKVLDEHDNHQYEGSHLPAPIDLPQRRSGTQNEPISAAMKATRTSSGDEFFVLVSRGSQQEPQDAKGTSKSYFTWSESVAPSRRSPRPERQSLDLPSQLGPSNGSLKGGSSREPSHVSGENQRHHKCVDGALHKPLEARKDRQEKGAQWVTTTQGQAKEPIRRMPDAPKKSPERRTTRPYLESAFGSVHPASGRDHGNKARRDSAASSYNGHGRTSDILKLRGHQGPRWSPSIRGKQHANYDQENLEPTHSSPNSQLLRDALGAVTQRREPYNSHQWAMRESHEYRAEATRAQQNLQNTGYVEPELQARQYVDLEGASTVDQRCTQNLPPARRGGMGGSMVSQRHRGSRPSSPFLHPHPDRMSVRASAQLTSSSVHDHPLRRQLGHILGKNDQAGSLLLQLEPEQVPRFYGDAPKSFDVWDEGGDGALHEDITQRKFGQDMLRRQDSLADAEIEDSFVLEEHDQLEETIVAEDEWQQPIEQPYADTQPQQAEETDELVGFWKPNVLY